MTAPSFILFYLRMIFKGIWCFFTGHVWIIKNKRPDLKIYECENCLRIMAFIDIKQDG